MAIFTYQTSGMSPWDPDIIKRGVTGSEEAVIYMSQQLAQLGYKVTVIGNPPAHSSHTLPDANPRFMASNTNDDTFYDVAISWRMPQKGVELRKKAHRVYFWPHDTYDGRLTEAQINSFDDVLWISKWQRQYWVSVNPGMAKFTKIFGNGINPDQFSLIEKRSNPYSCIYSSNYARGLEILLAIWPVVKLHYPRATLDIYYGWQHWGLLPPEKEAMMRKQIINLASLDVHEHGLVSHEVLNKAFSLASFWTYPCISLETFCITALRAQLSGAVPVIIDSSALKETVREGYRCDKTEEYLPTLLKAMSQAEKISLEDRKSMGDFVLNEFTWRKIATDWKRTMDNE